MKLTFVDKVGSAGTFMTALACPVCWPLFASLGSALGLGILAPYEGILMVYVFPGFVVVAIIGTVVSYLNHNRLLPMAVGLLSGGLILFGFYVGWRLWAMYTGIFGLLVSAVLSYLANRQKALLCRK